MSLVKGTDFIGLINIAGVWTPYICARSISVNTVTEAIETSVSGNGLWASYLPTKNSWTASTDGVVDLNESGSLTIADLQKMQFEQTIFQVMFSETDESGNQYMRVGYCFITNCQDSGSFDGVATFSLTLQGTGPLQIVKRFEYTSITGFETSFSDPSLIGITPIKVDRGGVDYTIITTGSPTPDEVLYNSGAGSFTFILPFGSAGVLAYVLYF